MAANFECFGFVDIYNGLRAERQLSDLRFGKAPRRAMTNRVYWTVGALNLLKSNCEHVLRANLFGV